jgi:hypothetical protein
MPRKQTSAASSRKAVAKKGPPPKGKVTKPAPKQAPPKPLKALTKAEKAPAPPAPVGKGAVKAAAKPGAEPAAPAVAGVAAKVKKARAAKKPAVPKAAPRLKIVWAVCDHTLKTIKTFPYPERRAAEQEADRLQKAKGKEHLVRAERVPMTAPAEARK